MSGKYTHPHACQISYFHKIIKRLDSFPHLLECHTLLPHKTACTLILVDPSLIPSLTCPIELSTFYILFHLLMVFVDSPMRCEFHKGGDFCPVMLPTLNSAWLTEGTEYPCME